MRTIDADAVPQEFWEYEFDGKWRGCTIKDLLDSQPTIQPEIVRCKDCIHRDPEDKKCDSGHGIVWQLPRDDDWYCADGER